MDPDISSFSLQTSYTVTLAVKGTQFDLTSVRSDVETRDDYRYIVPSDKTVFPPFEFRVRLMDAHGNLDITAGALESKKNAIAIYLDGVGQSPTSILTTGAYTVVNELEPGSAEILVANAAILGKFQERVKALGSADADGSQWNARIDIAGARGSAGVFTVDIQAGRFEVENAALDVGFSHNIESRLSFDIRYFGIDDLEDVNPIGEFQVDQSRGRLRRGARPVRSR